MESLEEFTVENHTEESHRQSSKDEVKQETSPTKICEHFLLGRCHFGDRCRLSHSLQDPAETADSEEEKGKVKCMNQETRAKTSAENQLVKKNNKGCNKKPRMRTADDVISRIIWDSAVDPADFVVGHLDRFLGVLERPFSDFSWDTQVCDCDFSEELALPRHRIQYFSYKGQRVWDRDSRTDRVFGSTGQSILPPFGSEDEKMIFKQETGQQDEDPNQADVVKDLEKATLTENAEDNDKEVQLDANPESLAQEILIPPNCNEELKDPQRDSGTELPSNAPQEQRSGRPPPRKPTHFVCFRVDSPAAFQAFRRIQKTVLSHLPESEPLWINPETLHVTLCLLVLKGPEEISAAAELLRAIIRDFYKPPISVSFTPKLKHFNGTVLHVTPQPLSDIQSLNAPLQEAFKEKGWLHRHSKCPTYHLTLAKMKEPMPEKIFDGIGSIKLAKDVNFGKLEVLKLYLCVNNQPKTESGFYQSVCAVPLPDV